MSHFYCGSSWFVKPFVSHQCRLPDILLLQWESTDLGDGLQLVSYFETHLNTHMVLHGNKSAFKLIVPTSVAYLKNLLYNSPSILLEKKAPVKFDRISAFRTWQLHDLQPVFFFLFYFLFLSS